MDPIHYSMLGGRDAASVGNLACNSARTMRRECTRFRHQTNSCLGNYKNVYKALCRTPAIASHALTFPVYTGKTIKDKSTGEITCCRTHSESRSPANRCSIRRPRAILTEPISKSLAPALCALLPPLGLLRLLLLQILIGIIGDNTTDEHNGIEANAETCALCVGSRGDGTGERSLGLRVTSLERKSCVSNTKAILAEAVGAGRLPCASVCQP